MMLHATRRATRDLLLGGAPTNLVKTFGIILRGGPFFRQRGAASTLAGVVPGRERLPVRPAIRVPSL
jgi:hypothetical protein